MSESSDDCELLEETQDEAKAATSRLLPEKSKSLYDRQYVSFIKWCEEKQIVHKFSETVILAYFSEKSKIFKSSTLLATYSMLKSTIALKENVDISKFEKLKAFLKRKATGYTAKKAKTFSRQEISKFLLEAPDMIFLLMKVILLMGLAGACRRNELANIKIDDIEDKESFLIVRIPYSKSNTQRTFVIPSEEENGVNPAQICRKYAALRPRNIHHRRFFLQYRNGKCSVHALGINQFAKIPCQIAKYLELPDPESYTGRTFRRSATLLVGSGADLIKLKSHGGRKPSNMMRGILEDCGENE